MDDILYPHLMAFLFPYYPTLSVHVLHNIIHAGSGRVFSDAALKNFPPCTQIGSYTNAD